jgi:hypothetical protein
MRNYKVTVFCASSGRVHEDYLNEAAKLGRMLAENGCEIIYGGGNIGLMGRLADAAIAAGGRVTGVIPKFMVNLNLGHNGISNLKVVDNMHARKSIMLKESDFIMALPGSCGTLEELLEAIAWRQLGLIIAPIIIINIKNYFKPLLEMLDRAVEENFMRREHSANWRVVDSVEEALEIISVRLPLEPLRTYYT